MIAALHEAGFTDIVPAHFAVFRYPPPEGRRPSDVAIDAGMTRQAMGYLLGQLEQLDYLTREGDPADQRSKRIHLTERGYAAAQTIRQAVREIEDDLETELGPEQFAELRQLLVNLNATNTIRAHRPRSRDALELGPPAASDTLSNQSGTEGGDPSRGAHG